MTKHTRKPSAHGPIRAISGARFAKLIASLGLSKSEAARFLGLNPRTVFRMVSGENRVDPATAMLLELMVKHDISPTAALKAIGIDVKAIEKETRPNVGLRFYDDRRA
jgi:hypothetical protein